MPEAVANVLKTNAVVNKENVTDNKKVYIKIDKGIGANDDVYWPKDAA